MEDKPESLNTQRDEGPLIKLKGSWNTKELKRITLTKIKEINLIFLNKAQLVFIDKNGLAYTKALAIRTTKEPINCNYNPLKLIIISLLNDWL